MININVLFQTYVGKIRWNPDILDSPPTPSLDAPNIPDGLAGPASCVKSTLLYKNPNHASN